MVRAVRPLFLSCDVKEVPADSAATILNRNILFFRSLSHCIPQDWVLRLELMRYGRPRQPMPWIIRRTLQRSRNGWGACKYCYTHLRPSQDPNEDDPTFKVAYYLPNGQQKPMRRYINLAAIDLRRSAHRVSCFMLGNLRHSTLIQISQL
jgi:hypothetical protein